MAFGRLIAKHDAGDSMNRIALDMTEADVPTASSWAKWYASTIEAILISQNVTVLAPKD
jgi:hypothetical protein